MATVTELYRRWLGLESEAQRVEKLQIPGGEVSAELDAADGAATAALGELLKARARTFADIQIQTNAALAEEERWPGLVLEEYGDLLLKMLQSWHSLTRDEPEMRKAA